PLWSPSPLNRTRSSSPGNPLLAGLSSLLSGRPGRPGEAFQESRLMKPSRSFRPSSPVALENRVVPSSLTGNVTTALAQLASQERKHGIQVQRVGISAVQLAQSNASETSFAAPKEQTLQSGISVAERKTTTYATGTPQTESILEVPNLSNNTVTTYKTINL